MSEIVTPDWVKDAIFYQIFPDTFARSERVPKPSNLSPWDSEPSHAFKGGDLLGVVEHLDYLQDLGITALYFCPVFASTAVHRYHTYDYYHVDPILGGDSALRELLDEAHRRGMRVILDGVFNHASRGFLQFNHALENGLASPYIDWFHFNREWLASGEPLDAYPSAKKRRKTWQSGASLEAYGYKAWWDLPAQPKFNTDHPAVREFLFGVAEHWLRFGIDGWRLDVPMEIDDDSFWREFRRRVKAINPEAYIVGEIWTEASRWLRGDQFDGVVNYVLQRACLRFFGGNALGADVSWEGHRLTPWRAVRFASEVNELLHVYDWQVTLAQLNLLGSHDTPRYLSQVGHDADRFKAGLLFLMAMPGAPCIYYGDEIGLPNVGKPGGGSRAAMNWDRSRWNEDLRAYVKWGIALRQAYPALRRGTFHQLYANNKANVYAFARKLEREMLVVVFNQGEGDWEIHVPLGGHLFGGVILRDLLRGGTCVVKGRHVEGPALPPHTGTVLRAEV